MPRNSQLLVDIGQGLFLMLGLPTIATWTTGERPKNAKRGTIGFNLQTNNLEYFDGAQWLGAFMGEL